MTYKTTGYALREAIKQHELRRDTAARAFNGSLRVFPGEAKDSPQSIIESFLAAERAIAMLQTVQMQYNLMVKVMIPGMATEQPLAMAIKLVGGVARSEKMWRSAAAPKEERYGYGDNDTRDPNQIRATATVAMKDLVGLATASAKQSAALRQAIAVANATEVTVESLDASLFE
jgi:hypothetical protein